MTTFGVLSSLHGRKVSLVFGGFILGLTVAMGWLINLVVGNQGVPIASLPGVEHAAWYHWVGLVAVALAYGLSLLRIGPRAFVGMILAFGRTSPPRRSGPRPRPRPRSPPYLTLESAYLARMARMTSWICKNASTTSGSK